jgi:hypothetical protein
MCLKIGQIRLSENQASLWAMRKKPSEINAPNAGMAHA